ncbi:MAG: DUF357 domain-containing protein [Candidatus Woesearchaeota archaeon]|nr:MAG: DUF357 domain-containing protein [Candidatus Woesearchaeota archaeon]
MKDKAQKEIDRLSKIFDKIKVKDSKKAQEFFDFAQRYFKDSKYFFEKKKYVEAFEATIIAWAYLDSGLKMDFFQVPKKLEKHFTA